MELAEAHAGCHALQVQLLGIMEIDEIQKVVELLYIFLLSGLAHVGEELLILNAVVDELHKKAQQQGMIW